MKKLISTILSVTLLLSAMSIAVSAQGDNDKILSDSNAIVSTFSSISDVENPGVYEGTELPFNTYKQSYQKTSYWKFTLDEAANVKFQFNAPTNKYFSATVYDEDGVYAYEYAQERSEISTYLDAGTYYVKLYVPSIGEDSIQIRISK